MKASLCILLCFSLLASFILGILNWRHLHNSAVQECECMTDENVNEYNKWLERESDIDGSESIRLLPTSTKHLVTGPARPEAYSPLLSSPTTLHWTRLDHTETVVFSAYYDNRKSLAKLPSVLVLGYQSKSHRQSSLYCFFKYKDGSTKCSWKSVVLEMDSCDKQKEFDRKREREYLHVFHVCLLDSANDEIPTHVALSVDHTCSSSSSATQVSTTGFIPVFQYRPTHKLDFGVCVQTPAFKKSFHDIVSFIELYKLLGAQRITLYSLDMEQSVLSLLQQVYSENNVLEIIIWTNHLHAKEPIHYYGEILAIHDCLYRNMHSVRYLAFVDLDEVLVPRRYRDWKSMLLEVDKPYIDSFIFMNSIYMKSPATLDPADTHNSLSGLAQCRQNEIVPQYFTHFNQVKCVFNYFSRSKLIVKPDLIFDTNIHGVCTRVRNTTHYFVPATSATSHHYRNIPTIECRKNRRTRKYDVVYDDWMLKFSSSLYSATNKIICNKKIQNLTIDE